MIRIRSQFFSTYSVAHEFASYVDNFQFGNFTERVYSNLMSKGNFKVGDEIVVRDFIQEDPDEKITIVIGKPKVCVH